MFTTGFGSFLFSPPPHHHIFFGKLVKILSRDSNLGLPCPATMNSKFSLTSRSSASYSYQEVVLTETGGKNSRAENMISIKSSRETTSIHHCLLFRAGFFVIRCGTIDHVHKCLQPQRSHCRWLQFMVAQYQKKMYCNKLTLALCTLMVLYFHATSK